MASESERAPGITSLSEALSLATAWLDGDVGASAAAVENISNNGKDGAGDDAPPTSTQTPIEKSIALLANLQTKISHNSLISKNEALDDVATSSLEMLGVEYQLGRAFLMLPTHNITPPPPINGNGSHNVSNGPSSSLLRKQNVTRAMEYYHSYLKRLEQLGEDMLQEDTLTEYHTMLDLEDMNGDDSNKQSTTSRMNPSQIRQLKIQRFQRKKSTTQKRTQLQSQIQRRSRLGITDEESMEGHDLESLSRTLYIETLRMYAEESLEEIQSCKGELEMLDMAITMEGARMGMSGNGMDPRMMKIGGRGDKTMPPNGSNNQQPQGPLQMTQITQHPITGELEYTKQHVSNGQLQPVASQPIQRQELSKGVFRPSWNQPTMTLDELAYRERDEAIARSEQQKVSEAENKFRPKRYDQLEKDGMEDDENLVEASAQLDRAWDDWKEENPRGSGNKNSERGDRNF